MFQLNKASVQKGVIADLGLDFVQPEASNAAWGCQRQMFEHRNKKQYGGSWQQDYAS